MNRAEIVDLLTFCAANDGRTVGDSDVVAWYDMLAPITFDRAMDAARRHYRQRPDDRLKPGHIWQMCKTTTVAEAAHRDLEKPCEHGQICADCKAVHHITEPCTVLISDPATFTRALAAFSRPPELDQR